MEKKITKKLEKELLEIVHKNIGLEWRADLEEHKTDDEDFFETSGREHTPKSTPMS